MRYYYQYSSRKTGEILLEGTIANRTKADAKKFAHDYAMRAGLSPMLDDNIKFYMKAM